MTGNETSVGEQRPGKYDLQKTLEKWGCLLCKNLKRDSMFNPQTFK